MPPAQVGAEGIYFAERLYPAHFAPSPLVCIYKTLEIDFFAIKNLINIFLTYHILYKFASAIGPFRADTFKKFLPNDSR